MKINLKSIKKKGYASHYKDAMPKEIVIEKDDVQKTIDNKNFETRIHHTNETLKGEWNNALNFEKSHELQTKFHTERVAAIVNDKLYNQPIIVNKISNEEFQLIDGGHRVHAADFLDIDELDAIIIEVNPDKKREILKEIKKFNGDIKQALESMNITYKL